MPARVPMTRKQRDALLALPTSEAEVIRHHSLDAEDLAAVAEARGLETRLGFALQLCVALPRPAPAPGRAGSASGHDSQTNWSLPLRHPLLISRADCGAGGSLDRRSLQTALCAGKNFLEAACERMVGIDKLAHVAACLFRATTVYDGHVVRVCPTRQGRFQPAQCRAIRSSRYSDFQARDQGREHQHELAASRLEQCRETREVA